MSECVREGGRERERGRARETRRGLKGILCAGGRVRVLSEQFEQLFVGSIAVVGLGSQGACPVDGIRVESRLEQIRAE